MEPVGKNKVLVDPDKLKKIAITCRCGVRTVHEIPGELLIAGAHPIVDCPSCTQSYVIDGQRIVRLDDDMQPDKIIQPAQATEFKETQPSKTSWPAPASKMIH